MEQRTRQKHVILACFVLCGLILTGRLFFLQIINDEYKITASNNVLRYEIIYPARGLILDRNGSIIVGNQTAYDIMITPKELASFDTSDFCNIFNLSRDKMESLLSDVDKRRNSIGYQSVIFLGKSLTNSIPDFWKKVINSRILGSEQKHTKLSDPAVR
jgi:penicillin-binding protein 2